MTDRRWYASVPCYGLTALFFPADGETPTAKQQRIAKARELCMTCQHRAACNELAGPADSQGRYEVQGVWAGAWCGDVYCGGIHCMAELDPDDPKDAEAIEVLQAVIRAGKVQIQANAVLARAENRA